MDFQSKNLLNDKTRFILALENPIAGQLFDNLVAFIKETFPTATGAYILNFEASNESHEITTLGNHISSRIMGWNGYVFDLVITQESGNTLQVNIIGDQTKFQLTDIQYELLG